MSKLRSATDAFATSDIMKDLGNEFTAEVIGIVNDNGNIDAPGHPSFRDRASHDSTLGRVAVRVRPLDYPTHIMIPE